jgi:hypothetical protein
MLMPAQQKAFTVVCNTMKLLFLTILCLIIQISFGQSYHDVKEKLEQFLAENKVDDTAKVWVDNILARRDTAYLNRQIAAAPTSKIKLVEVFDQQTGSYGIKETYADFSKVEFIFKDQKEDTLYNRWKLNYKYKFELIDTIKSRIIYFPPNTVEALCGCGQVPAKIRNKCLKDAERQAKKDGLTSEHFARLITYVDKTSGQVQFILELPAKGKRRVYYGLSPDDTNRRWYD